MRVGIDMRRVGGSIRGVVRVSVAVVATTCLLAAGEAEPVVEAPDAVVLPPNIVGELAASHRAAILGAFADGLGDAGVAHVLDRTDACADTDCRVARARAAATAFAIELEIDVVDRDYELTTRLFDDAGTSIAEVEQRCPICSLAEVTALARDQARAVAAKLVAVDTLATVAISSSPAGAAVRVDGVVLGATPLELRLPAGEHVVVLSRSGYAVAQRRLRLVARTREVLSMTLPPQRPRSGSEVVPTPSVARPRRALIAAGSTGLALGVAAVAASIPLFLIDGRAPEGGCTGLDVDFAGNCRSVHHTRTGASLAVTAGIVAITTGITLLVRGTRGRR